MGGAITKVRYCITLSSTIENRVLGYWVFCSPSKIALGTDQRESGTVVSIPYPAKVLLALSI